MNITDALYHRNSIIRKSAAALLAVTRRARQRLQTDDELRLNPPVLVNSFPKSGTHLLNQVASALPNRRQHGLFLSSMKSSFRFRERSRQNTLKCLRSFVAGEIARGHLFYHAAYDQALYAQNVVHYFILRDLRGVVVSEAHYLRSINRWHRLHRYFRELPSLADAITCSIQGLDGKFPHLNYPNVAERFARYEGWLHSPAVCILRFEDLVRQSQEQSLKGIAEFYARRLCYDVNPDALTNAMRMAINPSNSHTFREGKADGWRNEFSAKHFEMFDEIAGDLNNRLGYESNHIHTHAHQRPLAHV